MKFTKRIIGAVALAVALAVGTSAMAQPANNGIGYWQPGTVVAAGVGGWSNVLAGGAAAVVITNVTKFTVTGKDLALQFTGLANASSTTNIIITLGRGIEGGGITNSVSGTGWYGTPIEIFATWQFALNGSSTIPTTAGTNFSASQLGATMGAFPNVYIMSISTGILGAGTNVAQWRIVSNTK